MVTAFHPASKIAQKYTKDFSRPMKLPPWTVLPTGHGHHKLLPRLQPAQNPLETQPPNLLSGNNETISKLPNISTSQTIQPPKHSQQCNRVRSIVAQYIAPPRLRTCTIPRMLQRRHSETLNVLHLRWWHPSLTITYQQPLLLSSKLSAACTSGALYIPKYPTSCCMQQS